jgi:hypothetical protein
MTRRTIVLLLACAILVTPSIADDPNPASIQSNEGAWPLYRQWNRAEFEHYSKWIAHIYDVKANGSSDQRSAKIKRVLTDPAINLLLDPEFVGTPSNSQIDMDTIGPIHNVLDCGKLTIALTAYYSFRRGLPFMTSIIRSGDGTDIRRSSFNVPTGSISSFDYTDKHEFFVDSVRSFCTGNYRITPDGVNAGSSDTVPIALTRETLLPGTLYYLDGHVMILADIGEYGEVHFLDSTTAASRDIYTHNSLNAVVGLKPKRTNTADAFAGCYRGFRIYRFPIAVTDDEGNVLHVRRRTDEEMREFGFSLEQYEKMEQFASLGHIKEGPYELSDLHELLRYRLRTKTTVDPYELIEEYADELVAMFEQRDEFVQAAWREVQANGPIPFPEASHSNNVYRSDDRWGSWSSAWQDVDARSKYFALQDWIDSTIRWFDRDPDSVILSRWNQRGLWGRSDLALVITHEKNKIFNEKSLQYTNAAGDSVTLTLSELEDRLYDLSFDPNHPPELRWGARPQSSEASHAPEMATPVLVDDEEEPELVPMAEAYAREAYYRSLTRRETDPSYLREMFTSGFPIRKMFDAHIAIWYYRDPSPPIVPHNTRAHDRTRLGL